MASQILRARMTNIVTLRPRPVYLPMLWAAVAMETLKMQADFYAAFWGSRPLTRPEARIYQFKRAEAK